MSPDDPTGHSLTSLSLRRGKKKETWTFDRQHREAAKPLRNRNGQTSKQRARTPEHHPDLKVLGHTFGPELRCRCGLSYQVVCENPEPCKGD